MKRLFSVTPYTSRKPVPCPLEVAEALQLTTDGEYFANKQDAKMFRDKLNNGGDKKYRVSNGPDHIGRHGVRIRKHQGQWSRRRDS